MTSTEVPGSESRQVLLVVTPDPEANSGEAARLAHELCDGLEGLGGLDDLRKRGIESITLLRSDEMPTGAKGGPVSLLVTLGAFGGVITVLLQDLSSWLYRHRTVSRISVVIDGDRLELHRETWNCDHGLYPDGVRCVQLPRLDDEA